MALDIKNYFAYSEREQRNIDIGSTGEKIVQERLARRKVKFARHGNSLIDLDVYTYGKNGKMLEHYLAEIKTRKPYFHTSNRVLCLAIEFDRCSKYDDYINASGLSLDIFWVNYTESEILSQDFSELMKPLIVGGTSYPTAIKINNEDYLLFPADKFEFVDALTVDEVLEFKKINDNLLF